MDLPEGGPDDPPDRATVSGLGNRNNDTFAEVLRTEGVRVDPGSLALLDRLADRGPPMAVVSSSRNAPAVLTAAGPAATNCCPTAPTTWSTTSPRSSGR